MAYCQSWGKFGITYLMPKKGCPKMGFWILARAMSRPHWAQAHCPAESPLSQQFIAGGPSPISSVVDATNIQVLLPRKQKKKDIRSFIILVIFAICFVKDSTSASLAAVAAAIYVV